MLSIGPPKQAEKPMTGAKAATEMLATKSARELPTAKIVKPIMASERPKMKLELDELHWPMILDVTGNSMIAKMERAGSASSWLV